MKGDAQPRPEGNVEDLVGPVEKWLRELWAPRGSPPGVEVPVREEIQEVPCRIKGR